MWCGDEGRVPCIWLLHVRKYSKRMKFAPHIPCSSDLHIGWRQATADNKTTRLQPTLMKVNQSKESKLLLKVTQKTLRKDNTHNKSTLKCPNVTETFLNLCSSSVRFVQRHWGQMILPLYRRSPQVHQQANLTKQNS
jgi:hypothetical protein